MVKSEKLYTPQSYVEALTGNCYVFGSDNVIEQIANVMLFNKLPNLFDYPLSEFDHIVENKINVVLVDVSCFDKHGIWKHEYRWFEVPDDFKEEDE